MKPKMFTCSTLPLLADGDFAAAVNAKLAEVHADLDGRPMNNKARSVTITLEFTPNVLNTQSTHLEDVRVGFKVKSSRPDLGPVHVQMVPKHDGLMFHPDVAEDPHQMSIMEAVDRGE
jgi:hypothetical protein